jgi:NhaP-type Na+/H+ or K+/H+ antiporter
MSWREFRYDIRSISLLAFGGVTFTTVAVAAVVHYLLGWDWSVGFVLGAIISPPDEVAPLAIARRLGLPRRTMVVIEGEGSVITRSAAAGASLRRIASSRNAAPT